MKRTPLYLFFARTIFGRAIIALFVLQLLSFVTPSAYAAPDDWNGVTDSQWNTNTNWSLGLKPTAADDAIFPSVVPITGSNVALGAGEVANTLTLHNNYNLLFGSLTLTTGTITADSNGSGIIGTMLTGAGSITKEGAGLIALDGANNYTGGTTLNAGTLIVGNNSALGTGTATINGGTFGVGTFSETISNNVTVNADFNVVSDAVFILNGTVDLAGGSRTITALSSGNGNNLRFQGVIQNGTGLTLAGTTLSEFNYTMSGAASNTYTGTTTVDNAALSLEKSGAAIAIPGNLTVQNDGFVTFRATGQIAAASLITLNDGNLGTIVDINVPNDVVLSGTFNQVFQDFGSTLTLSGMISGTGPLLQRGDFSTGGTLVLTNSNNYSGGTALNNGSLYADNNDALGTGQLDIFGGTTFGSHVDGTTLPNSIEVHGDFSIAPATVGASTFILNGDMDLGGATRTITSVTTFSNATFAGAISNGGLTLDSTQPFAAFTFSGATANTYTGLTAVQNAFLNLNKSVTNGAIAGDLLVNANGAVDIRANEQIADTSTVTIASMGNFTLGDHTETIGSLLGSGDLLLNDGGGSAGGTFIIGAGDFSGLIRDDGHGGKIVKNTSGTFILESDNTYNGGTTVNAGVLAIGSLNAMGLGDVVVNGGTLQSFNGPRAIAVGGLYTQNSGGTLRLQIGGINSGSDSDFLTVTGLASLNGTLALVRINNFNPMQGDRVNIIGGPGGHTGMFSNVTSTFTGVLQPVPHYDDPLDVYILFEVTSFNLGGLTPNQKSVANELDEVANDPRATALVNFLTGEPFGNLTHDYDLIAPEELASIYEISISQAMVTNNNLQHRMDDIRAGSNGYCPNFTTTTSGKDSKDVMSDGGKMVAPSSHTDIMLPAPENPWGVFVTGSGQFVNVGNDDDNAHGYDITTGNVLVGVDYRVTDHFAIGVDGSYTGGTADLVDRGRVEVDGGKAGVYATVFGKGFFGSKTYVNGAVSGGWNSYDTLRNGLQDLPVRGSTNGGEFNAMISYGSEWSFGCFNIGTWSTIQYTMVQIDEFTETGSLAPLIIQDQKEDSIRSTTGLRASYDIKMGQHILRPEVRAGWQTEYGDPAYQVDARFASGAGDVFRVRGPKIGQDSALVDGGLALQWSRCCSAYIYYDGVLGRNNYDSHAISGGLRVSF